MVLVCLPFDARSQHLPSYLGFSYLGRGVSLHGCSSKARPLLLTLVEGYLLTAAPPEEAEVEQFHEDLQKLLELTPKKDVLFIMGDWNAKVGSQETPGVTGIFGLGVRNEAGRRLIEFCQENPLVIAKPSSKNTREDSTHGHHQMVNTEIRLIIFFAAKDIVDGDCSHEVRR